jgi:hypothetical protein
MTYDKRLKSLFLYIIIAAKYKQFYFTHGWYEDKNKSLLFYAHLTFCEYQIIEAPPSPVKKPPIYVEVAFFGLGGSYCSHVELHGIRSNNIYIYMHINKNFNTEM